MTRDVLVTIKGLQYAMDVTEEEDQRIETINRGIYGKRNGKEFISFEETFDASTKISNLIKFYDGCVEVNKKGPFSVNMFFEEGKKNSTDYRTPYGNLIVGIDTDSIKTSRTDEEISIQIKYNMEVNYEQLAECTIDILVQSINE